MDESPPPASKGADAHAGFERGMLAGRDPANTERLAQREAVTTLRSPWLHLRCHGCGHSFRRGDPVRFDPEGRPVHDLPDLPCSGDAAAAELALATTDAFVHGLETAWPPSCNVTAVRLSAGHPLLAPPRGAFRRHACFVCGHTLRPNDRVVFCPCGLDPSRCRVAVHLDAYQSLFCFPQWSPNQTRRYCPATSRPLDE